MDYVDIDVDVGSGRFAAKLKECASKIRIAKTGLPLRSVGLRLGLQDGIEIRVCIDVKDRDTFVAIPVYGIDVIPYYYLEARNDRVAILSRAVYDSVRRIILHELDECFQVNGERAWNAHAMDVPPKPGTVLNEQQKHAAGF